MRYRHMLVVATVTSICSAIFIVLTREQLPAMMASHFDAAGVANGFSSREMYVTLMAGTSALIAFVVILPTHFLGRPGAKFNLMNADYWLAPERRAETVEWLQTRILWFAVATPLFFAYLHWQVIRANRSSPVHLPGVPMFGALCVIGCLLALWLVLLFRRFSLPAR
jgi:uncharacterized membrane protein